MTAGLQTLSYLTPEVGFIIFQRCANIFGEQGFPVLSISCRRHRHQRRLCGETFVVTQAGDNVKQAGG